jgi:methylated-DNA-protein-cysteine methyltransferase-like protein
VTGFEDAVVGVIASLQPGDVVTYGEVAAEAGYPGAARAVGTVLRKVDADIPWWRVVGAGGHIRSPDAARQARLLGADGVLVVNGRVRLGPDPEYGQ